MKHPKPDRSSATAPPKRRHDPTPPPRLHASLLFRDSNEVLIEHGGATYRLRLTRQNRLILTK